MSLTDNNLAEVIKTLTPAERRAVEETNKPRKLKPQPDAEVETLKRKLRMAQAVAEDLAAWIQRKHKAGEEKCNFTK